MCRPNSVIFVSAVSFLLLLFVLTRPNAARAQCVDSSEVHGFKVRSIKFRSLFGATPSSLQQLLDSHRGEAYSASRASLYINEIRKFFATDSAQQKYEKLIAQKLKLSVKAGRTWLECVEKVRPTECQKAFPGSSECVDVKIRRYFVDIDALDSSPYLLLFPRSALAALYGAIPRPLLALNPGFNANEDARFGPSVGVDTATDLLDLLSIFGENEPSTEPRATLTPTTTPRPGATPDDLDITFPVSGDASTADEQPPVDLEKRDTKLLLRLQGRKSLSNSFYDTSTGLTLARTKALDTFQNLALEARFDARHLPQGEGDFLTNAGSLAFSTDLRLKGGPIKLINVGGAYRWSRNRFTAGTGTVPSDVNSENGFEARVLADGMLAKGLTRAALWFDGGALDRSRGSYQRVAAVVGYGKDFIIPRKKEFRLIRPPELGGRECWTSYAEDPKKNEPTIGFEILAGAGRAWGDIPEYARFYAGSPSGQFLYDELSAQTLTVFPAGPMLRSQGQQQAGVTVSPGVVGGGSSFWHANVNVSVPIPAWSRPLIPHEWVTTSALRDDDKEFKGHVPAGADVCRDLKSTVKTLVGISGINLMVNQQARDMLSDAQKKDLRLRNKEDRTPEEESRLLAAETALSAAKARVKPQVEALFAREILPITNFIADHANMVAVKPLLIFDVARLALSGFDNRTRYGVGGGLQLDVVLARFEFGYVAALNRAPGDRSGNFVGRLILKRFF